MFSDNPHFPFVRLYGDSLCACGCGAELGPHAKLWVGPGHWQRHDGSPCEVDQATGCWEWLWRRERNGYGRIKFGREKIGAHRLAYLVFNGEIPPGMMVRHSCDNPGCVNPKHLSLGDHDENMADKYERGRCPSGERHHRTSLTAEQVLAIRDRYAKGETQLSLAREFGIRNTTVSNMVNGKSWKNLEQVQS